MIKIYCDGRDGDGRQCREYVTSRDQDRLIRWQVVLITPMAGGDSVRKVLCGVCSRRHKGAFKDG